MLLFFGTGLIRICMLLCILGLLLLVTLSINGLFVPLGLMALLFLYPYSSILVCIVPCIVLRGLLV